MMNEKKQKKRMNRTIKEKNMRKYELRISRPTTKHRCFLGIKLSTDVENEMLQQLARSGKNLQRLRKMIAKMGGDVYV